MQARRPVAADAQDRFEERRRELASSALTTLGELGYARTSLREVAQRSEYSHGVLHYYFTDRLDLITYAVREHKRTSVHRFDAAIEAADDADALVAAFAGGLARSVVADTPTHQLWYDVKTQSMFEPGLRETVEQGERWLGEMVERVLVRAAELSGREVVRDRASTYRLLDGAFYNGLYRYLGGDEDALLDMVEEVGRVLDLALSPVR
jgi:TetR/AcrR family transcriptional regulator, transcriptional repressor of bet genes